MGTLWFIWLTYDWAMDTLWVRSLGSSNFWVVRIWWVYLAEIHIIDWVTEYVGFTLSDPNDVTRTRNYD